MDFENIIWNEENFNKYINYLISMQDIEYKQFHQNLTQTKYEIIGVRVPILRNIAKQISKTDIMDFLNTKPSNYYEDITIRGMVISYIKDETILKKKIIEFSYLIDNWAINDSFVVGLKIIKKNKKSFYPLIDELIKINMTFSIRLALIILLDYYVEADYIDDILKIVEETKSDEYYINMARAWLLCDCFVKQKEKTLLYLEENKLDKFTINKTVSKIRDSYRVSKEDKEYVLKFRKMNTVIKKHKKFL